MASIGMRHLVMAPFAAEQTEGQLPTYESGVKLRAISATITLNRNESELYADDTLAERDNTLTGGDVDLTVAEVPDEAGAKLFGSEQDEMEQEYHDSDKSSPYIGMGYMREQKVQGKSNYRAVWFYKVQLAAAEETAQTKAETTTFQTQRVTGEVLGVTLADGTTRFRAWKTFEKAAEAVAWLNKKANYQAA